MDHFKLMVSEPENYIGALNGTYTKRRFKVELTVPKNYGVDGKVTYDIVKAEPIIDAEGKLVSWAFYSHRLPRKDPKFSHTLRAIVARMQAEIDANIEKFKAQYPAPVEYEVSSEQPVFVNDDLPVIAS